MESIRKGEVVYPVGSRQPQVVLAADKGFLQLAGGLVFEGDVTRVPGRNRCGARMRKLAKR